MSETKRKMTAWDEREAILREITEIGALRSPAELVEAVMLPTDLAAVLATGRPELLKIIEPRALSVDECARLYQLIGVLIRTNYALKQHAVEVSKMASDIESQLRGANRFVARMSSFANFNSPLGDWEEGE